MTSLHGTVGTVGRLLSVNVGLPKDVAWQGRTVHTGIWKRPVPGPQRVRTLNIDGDGQGDLGGHGGPHRAVLVYQQQSYDHWRSHLGRDDLRYGDFGENFTVDGLADADVCIGDNYRIGDAVFEVSQPRVTCYRVGLRLDEPRLPSLLVSHRRPGFYLRVLQEGWVQAGDEIVKLTDGPERMNVARVDGLLYLPNPDSGALAKALRIPQLSPGWQGSFRAITERPAGAAGNPGLTEAAAAPPVAWPGFRPVRVLQTRRESESVLSLQLGSTDGSPLPKPLPGQFITVRVTERSTSTGRPGAALLRSYSLSGAVDEPTYRISVKRHPGGAAGELIHRSVRVGDLLDLAAPRGTFVLTDGDGPLVLVSGGIGVTPLLAMLHAVARHQPSRPLWWAHGARNGRDDAFAAEAGALMGGLTDATAEIVYSAPDPADRVGIDYSRAGRIGAAVLRELRVPSDAEAFVCGPAGFLPAITDALTELGIADSRIHSEAFGAGASLTPGIAATAAVAPHLPVGVRGTGPDVTFARTGLTVPWPTDLSSILELAEACDVPTQWSCRTGVCHTCETGLISGTIFYDPAPLAAPAHDNVLLCCSTPTSAVVVDA